MCAAKSSFNKKNARKQKKPIQKTRKEKRKEKRVQKKQSRNAFNQNKSKKQNNFVEENKEKNEKLIKNVKFNVKDSNDRSLKVEGKVRKNVVDKLTKKHELEKKQEEKLKMEMLKHKKKQMLESAMDDDRTIKQAEKFLKMNKRKNKNLPKSFISDGVDYILDMCDEEKRKIVAETEKQLIGVDPEFDFEEDFYVAAGESLKKRKKKRKDSEDSDFMSDEDISSDEEEMEMNSDASKTKKKKLGGKNKLVGDDINSDDFDEENDDTLNTSDEEDENEMNSDEENEMEINSDEEEEMGINSDEEEEMEMNSDEEEEMEMNCDEEEEMEMNSDEEDEMEANTSFLSGDDDDNNDSDNDSTKEGNSKNWEDIYGRTRDKDGNVLSNRYVPPAVRAKNLEQDSQNNEKLIQLKRQLKGPLNRLTDRNMHTISSQIEELYQQNSRNDMNEMLTKLIFEALVLPTMTPDRLIIEHMMLVAVLHANVGSEVGSQFLLTLVKQIHESLAQSLKVENKELDNSILMLSHLYNFKVCGSKLIYEILEKLSEKFTEKEIDLILLILKSVGFPLRKDDPIALKELIVRLQKKATETKHENSRVKFMLDILLAIKNNNINKIPQYDPSVMEHMKKLIKTLIRKGNSVSQLNITLDDLLNADERGKWWIVGAAWTGNATATKLEKQENNKPEYSKKLLELARKQRMNTDTRRNIFCILMSAEDYLDAFEKLHRLSLRDGQEKEIIHVLLNCCLQESNFNPYYAVLAQKFCDYDRKYQMTIQYTLWDKLKTLNTFNNKQIKNLALFLTHLFLQRGLSISTMKVIQLDELDKQKMKLLRQIVLGIFMHENLENCLAVFERITRSDKLNTFREALRLFINQFVVKNVDEGLVENDKTSLIKQRSELIDRILITRHSRTVF